MSVPAELKYTEQHEWLRIDGDLATVGITRHAADALGDVVYLDLPDVGAQVVKGEACGEVESTKSVSDLFSPADATVVEVNAEALADPGLVNTDPYGAGWLLRLRVQATLDLLDADAYARLLADD